MYILITLFHVIFCIALILIVLLQTGKGSDLASAFGGGGAQAVFGGRGPTSFLNKMTTIAAVLFMATSVTLAYMSGGHGSSVMGNMKEPTVATEQPAKTGDEAKTEESGKSSAQQSADKDQKQVEKPAAASSAEQKSNSAVESAKSSAKSMDSQAAPAQAAPAAAGSESKAPPESGKQADSTGDKAENK